MANRPQKPRERFYHLRMSKHEGPYLHRSGIGFTEDFQEAWLGNIKAVQYAKTEFPLAWIMDKVPSLHRQVKP